MQQLLPAFVGVPQTNRVYNVTAEVMLSALPSDSIDLIVTSPPYDNLRTYNGFTWDFEYIARQSYRVLKPGGVLVWVVGDATVNGSETLTSSRQAIFFHDTVGFNLHDTMIYYRDARFPETTRYWQVWEFMYVFSKGTPKVFNPILRKNKHAGTKILNTQRERDGRLHHGSGYGTEFKEYGPEYNLWYIPAGYKKSTKDDFVFEHPAIFPEELARRHIETWSNPGDLVLDYFGGSGTTAREAQKARRAWITNDLSRKYCDLMERRLAIPYTLPMFAQPA